MQIAFSTPSTQPNRKGWDWDYRSAVPLLKRMAAVCGRGQTHLAAASFVSRYPHRQTGFCQMQPAERGQTVVAVIDDDRNIRDAIESLLQSVGLPVQSFGSVTEFLSGVRSVDLGCLVLDVRLPGRSGLDFYDDLVKANIRLPVVFISGHADVPMSVRAMKAGAVGFPTKPVRHQELLDAIQLAMAQSRARRDEERSLAGIRE